MPYDESPNPSNGAFYLDKKPKVKIELIEYSFDKSRTLWVPGDWNSQENKLLYYECTIWYCRLFDYKTVTPNNRIFVHFGVANYESDIYMNGKKLGKHIGGFTPFNCEITWLLKADGNSLILKVDNKRKQETTLTLNTNWWNYGGITRDVTLVEVSNTFIQDYLIHLKKGSANEITGYIQLNGSTLQQTVKVAFPN